MTEHKGQGKKRGGWGPQGERRREGRKWEVKVEYLNYVKLLRRSKIWRFLSLSLIVNGDKINSE